MDQSPAWLVEDRSTIILPANVCVEEQEQEDGGEIRDMPLIQSRSNDLSLDAHLIMNSKQLARESWIEFKNMWDILGLMIFNSIHWDLSFMPLLVIWVPLN